MVKILMMSEVIIKVLIGLEGGLLFSVFFSQTGFGKETIKI